MPLPSRPCLCCRLSCSHFSTEELLTSKLGCRRAPEGNEARGVDDTASGAEALALICGVLAHREDRVLAPPPHALDVDVHREVPYPLLRV